MDLKQITNKDDQLNIDQGSRAWNAPPQVDFLPTIYPNLTECLAPHDTRILVPGETQTGRSVPGAHEKPERIPLAKKPKFDQGLELIRN